MQPSIIPFEGEEVGNSKTPSCSLLVKPGEANCVWLVRDLTFKVLCCFISRSFFFQVQHLESVLSSKEETLRHAQEAHEQTVNKVRGSFN